MHHRLNILLKILLMMLASSPLSAGNMWANHGYDFSYVPAGTDDEKTVFPIAWDIRNAGEYFRMYCESYFIETSWNPMMEQLAHSREHGFTAAVVRSEMMRIGIPEPYGNVDYSFAVITDSIRAMGLDVILGGFWTEPGADVHNMAVLEYLDGYIEETAGLYPGDVISIFGFDEPAVKYLENPAHASEWIAMVVEYSKLCEERIELPFTSFLSKYGSDAGGVWRYYSDTTSVLNRFSRYLDIVTFDMYPAKNNTRRERFIPLDMDSILFCGATDLLPSEADHYYEAFCDRDEFFTVTLTEAGCRFTLFEFISTEGSGMFDMLPVWSEEFDFVPTGMASSDFRASDVGDRAMGVRSPSGVVVLWDSLAPSGSELVLHYSGSGMEAATLPAYPGPESAELVFFSVGDSGERDIPNPAPAILGRGQPVILGCYRIDGTKYSIVLYQRSPDGGFIPVDGPLNILKLEPEAGLWGRFWGPGIPAPDETLRKGGFVLYDSKGSYIVVRLTRDGWQIQPMTIPFYGYLFGGRTDPESVFIVHEDSGELPYTGGQDYISAVFNGTPPYLVRSRSYGNLPPLTHVLISELDGLSGPVLSAGSYRPDRSYGDILLCSMQDRVLRSSETIMSMGIEPLEMEDLARVPPGEVLPGARVMDTRRNIRAGFLIGETGITFAGAEIYLDDFDAIRFDRFAESFEVVMDNAIRSTSRSNCAFANVQSYGRHAFGLPSYCASRDTLLYMVTVPVIKGCRGLVFYGLDLALMSGNRSDEGELTYPNLLQNWGPSRDREIVDMVGRIHSVIASLTGNGPGEDPDFLGATVDSDFRVLSGSDAVNCIPGSDGFLSMPSDTPLNFLALENRNSGTLLLLVANDSEYPVPSGRGIAFPGRFSSDYSLNAVEGFNPARESAPLSGISAGSLTAVEDEVLVLDFGGMLPRSVSLIEMQPEFAGAGPGGSIFLDVRY